MEQINAAGFVAHKTQVLDAALVLVLRQRSKRSENAQIENGETPELWPEDKCRQKDINARWVKKHGKSHYDCKNPIRVDRQYKIIRKFSITSAEVHESRVFTELLNSGNSSADVWADSAYRSREHEILLETAWGIAVMFSAKQRANARSRNASNKPITNAKISGSGGTCLCAADTAPGANDGGRACRLENRDDEPRVQHARWAHLTG